MSNTPSDAEIVAVMRDGYNCRYNDEQDHIDFARAVLAKWGTPQPTAAEFALQALVAAGHVSQELVDKALTLPGAPQPVVREPLTDWKIKEIMELVSDWGMQSCLSGEAQLDAHNPDATAEEIAHATECVEQERAAWSAIQVKIRDTFSGITQKGGSNAE